MESSTERGREVFGGLPGSPGVAVGPALVLSSRRAIVPRRWLRRSGDGAEELRRFDAAVEVAARELEAEAGEAASTFKSVYRLMLQDPLLREEVAREIEGEQRAVEWALEVVVARFAERLRGSGDAYFGERGDELELLAERLQAALQGEVWPAPRASDGGPVVLVAGELSPAALVRFRPGEVLALVTRAGTPTSHTSIIARALGLPAVVGVQEVPRLARDGELLLVDGDRGQVVRCPSLAEQQEVERAAEQRGAAVPAATTAGGALGATTACGVEVALLANLDLGAAEALDARPRGAQGVGLARTELLALRRTSPPAEPEQHATYARLLRQWAPLPVTLRTFDLGGDELPWLGGSSTAQNPALGLRGLRLALRRPELLRPQLRAALRAASEGHLRLLLPMVTSVEEVRAVRRHLSELQAELQQEGMAPAPLPPVGVMVEVPAVALLARAFTEDVDFFSVGTNDLLQYLYAADRGCPELAALGSHYSPALLKLVRAVVDAARPRGLPVSVCGAMASDPLGAALLVGLGVRALSVELGALERVRAALSGLTLATLAPLVAELSELGSAEQAHRVARARLGPIS